MIVRTIPKNFFLGAVYSVGFFVSLLRDCFYASNQCRGSGNESAVFIVLVGMALVMATFFLFTEILFFRVTRSPNRGRNKTICFLVLCVGVFVPYVFALAAHQISSFLSWDGFGVNFFVAAILASLGYMVLSAEKGVRDN